MVGSATGLAQAITLFQVSHPPSPLTACAAQDTGQFGSNFLNGTEEPFVAVDGSQMIGMWHQDRWSDGGAHGIGVGTSNGGQNWNESTLPVGECAPGTPPSLSFYLRNSDPWVSFGPDHKAYASALAFNLGVPNNDNAVAVATSSNFGATWDNAQPVPGSVFTQFAQSTDKNSTTADPTKAGVAYTVWDTLIEPTDQPDDNPHTSAFTGPAFFSKTVDGGKTWSQATVMIKTPQRQQTIGNIIVVDPRNDNLYDFTDLIQTPDTPRQGTRSTESVAFVKSTDGGNTWTEPQVIAPFNELGVHDPNTGQPLRVGDGLEEVAIDPNSGNLYVVWESSTNFDKNLKQSLGAWDNEILLASSSNGGASWTTPVVVHSLANGMPTYTPMVAVNGGRIAVTYYDNRNLQPNQTANLPTDYFITFSTDGGKTFGGEERLTATSFDQMAAPVARGLFLGDYEGLQPSGTGFEVMFVKTNCNSTDPGGQNFPTGGLCAPASSSTKATSNTDPTDVFAAAAG